MLAKYVSVMKVLIVTVCCVTAQQKGTKTKGDNSGIPGSESEATLTGTLSLQAEPPGINIDLCYRSGQWVCTGSAHGNTQGNIGGSIEATHTRGNWKFSGSVSGDNQGNRGIGVGVQWRFGRSLQRTVEHFDVTVIVNHCNFNVYDKNEDGIVNKSEFFDVFTESLEAGRLFESLDINSDGQITREEFRTMTPKVMNKCNNAAKIPYKIKAPKFLNKCIVAAI